MCSFKMITDFQSKIVTVVGLGVSGYSAAKLLKDLGAQVRITDNQINEAIKRRCERLKELQIDEIELGGHSEKFIDGSSLLVVSPGVNKDNKIIRKAKNQNIPIISEIELGFLICSAPIIAITGTNGKTTVCSLVYEILKKAGRCPILCGNIGKPFCDVASKADSNNIIVLEVSSFQLMFIERFRPKISVILNIAPDHLDYHLNLTEYYQTKSKIFKNQKKDDFSILRKEDYEKVFSHHQIRPHLSLISTKDKGDLYIDNKGYVVAGDRLVHTSGINLNGIKSLENVLFILAISMILKIDKGMVLDTINNFKGLKHRLEVVGVYDGIKYVDDSKATNVAATRFALNNIREPVILIAGGQYKDIEVSRINLDFLDNVKEIILMGKSKKMLAEVLKKVKPVLQVDNMQDAVKIATKKARRGDCILLSPMCASFDMFKNYKERGEQFAKEATKIGRRLCSS